MYIKIIYLNMSFNDQDFIQELNTNEYSIVNVFGDCNYFYRWWSFEYEHSEINFPFYRNLIYGCVIKNKELLKDFFHMEEGESHEAFTNRYENTIYQISKDGTYAGDFEIHVASCVLNRNIAIYTKAIRKYIHYATYHTGQILKMIQFIFFTLMIIILIY